MKFHKCPERGRIDQRDVAGQNQHITGISGELLTRRHDGMAGSELLFLIHELYFGNQRLDFVGRVADDNPDVCRKRAGAAQHMFHERASAHTMKNFGVFGFHAGTLARGENQHSKVFHRRLP